MKKVFSLILSVFMIVSCFAIAASAEEAAPVWTKEEPALVISEFIPDCAGNGIGGWSDGKDVFEALEIYNNSDIPQNLYDYCITYNGNDASSALYENCIIEITPFLTNNVWENKPGNYLDATDFQKNWTATDFEVCDLSNLPTNPETCVIQPGECVVVWSMYCEAYYAKWNEGKGMSIADFRTFWNIPDSVQVIAWDGDSNATHGGYDKNFNLKNSATGSYGIAKYSEILNAAANMQPTTKDETGKYGYINIYDEKTYREFEDLISWTTLNFTAYGLSSKANMSYTFTIDADGSGAEQLTGMTGKEHLYDKRRMILLEAWVDTPTLGSLSDIQKMTFTNYKFKAGEKIVLPDVDTCEFLSYEIYYREGQKLTGFEVNGKVYEPGATFTADAAGKYTFKPVFASAAATTLPVTTAKPAETKAPDTKAPDTKAPDAPNTKAPDAATTEAPKASGCGSAISAVAVAAVAMLGTAVVFKKRK